MTNIPLTVSLILIPICSFFLWLPWHNHVKFFYPVSSRSGTAALAAAAASFEGGAQAIPDLNLDSCSRLPVPEGLGWCSQPVIHRDSGWAYFACDDTRPWWDPARLHWEQPPAERQGGSLWAWHLKDHSSTPIRLTVQSSHQAQPFHPVSISVASPRSQEDSTTFNILIVSNHPKAKEAGVVDILRHEFNSSDARLYERVDGIGLSHQSPSQVVAVAEQWSERVPPEHDEQNGGPPMALPSFIFSAFAQRCAKPSPSDKDCNAIALRADPPTITQYLVDVLWHRIRRPSAPRQVYLHLAAGHISKPLVSAVSTLPSRPALVEAWDGGGTLGGSNSSILQVYVASLGPQMAVIEQWDQHGVQGPTFGAEVAVNRRTLKEALVKWPSFVTFWNKAFDMPLRGITRDAYGRLWTVGAVDEGRAEALVQSLRRSTSTGETGTDAIDPAIDAGAVIHQTTYIHRVGPAMAHPWEIERLGKARKRGLWLPKEWFTSQVYRRGVSLNSKQAGSEGYSSSQAKPRKGFLPQAPTGIAVDLDRKRVFVTSSWDQGVAVCAFKEGFVEE